MSQPLLVTSLLRWFYVDLETLPTALRTLVKRNFIVHWDNLTPRQRRLVAEQLDAQSAQRSTIAEKPFREEFKRARAPHRKKVNTRNAGKDRPSSQRVSGADVERAYDDAKKRGITCAEAYRKLKPCISMRGFRERWNKVKRKRGT